MKAFDCISHDLLIVKLSAYGFNRNAPKLIYDYFSDRSQKTKVGSSFSAYLDIIYGIPQGSMLGPLLFNIDLRDLVFEDYCSEFANFADDTTPYNCEPTLNKVVNTLETTTEKMFKWFGFSNLKANASKGHLFLSPYQPVPVNIKGSIIEYHINRICRKASQKLHALSRTAKHISEDEKPMLFKSFIILQFNYCPIVWMCHGRGLNNKINNIHERALRIVYQDKKSSFETLLKRDKSTSIHVKNPQYLATSYLK